MKKAFRTILIILATSGIILSLALFFLLASIRSVVYDEAFIRSIPDAAYVRQVADRVGERLAAYSQYYEIDEDVLRTSVDTGQLSSLCENYYMELYMELTTGEDRITVPDYPYEGYETVLKNYFDGLKENDPEIRVDSAAVTELAKELARETSAETICLDSSYVSRIASYTSHPKVKLVIERSWFWLMVTLLLGGITFACARGGIEARITHLAFYVMGTGLFFAILGILFIRADIQSQLILADSGLRQLVTALISGFLKKITVMSAIVSIGSGLLFTGALTRQWMDL